MPQRLHHAKRNGSVRTCFSIAFPVFDETIVFGARSVFMRRSQWISFMKRDQFFFFNILLYVVYPFLFVRKLRNEIITVTAGGPKHSHVLFNRRLNCLTLNICVIRLYQFVLIKFGFVVQELFRCGE